MLGYRVLIPFTTESLITILTSDLTVLLEVETATTSSFSIVLTFQTNALFMFLNISLKVAKFINIFSIIFLDHSSSM